MLKGISYWSVEGGMDNAAPIERALAEAKAAGFDALELAIAPDGQLHTQSTQAECRQIRERIDASGVAVETLASGMSWAFNPASDDPAVREQAVELHAAALQRAAWLGCDALLFVPGVVRSPIAPDQCIRYDVAMERCRSAVEQLLDTAEAVGVDLCLENVWNGLLLSPLELRDFVDSFESDRLGVYLDCGNLLRYHQHPPHWIELLGPRIRRVHVKGFAETFGFTGSYVFSPLGEGDVPWTETVAALRAIGYDRTVIAEMLPYKPGQLDATSAALGRILG